MKWLERLFFGGRNSHIAEQEHHKSLVQQWHAAEAVTMLHLRNIFAENWDKDLNKVMSAASQLVLIGELIAPGQHYEFRAELIRSSGCNVDHQLLRELIARMQPLQICPSPEGTNLVIASVTEDPGKTAPRLWIPPGGNLLLPWACLWKLVSSGVDDISKSDPNPCVTFAGPSKDWTRLATTVALYYVPDYLIHRFSLREDGVRSESNQEELRALRRRRRAVLRILKTA